MIDKRLLKEGKEVSVYLLGTVALGIMIALLAVVQAWLVAKVIALVFLEQAGFAEVWNSLLVILLIIGGRGILQYLSEWSAREGAIRLKENLRSRFLNRLIALGPHYVRGERAGELLNTTVEGIETLDDYFSRYVPQLVLAVAIPLLILGFVFPFDLTSGSILLLTGPLIPVFMILIGKLAEKKSQAQWQNLSRMNAHFLDVLQGLSTLKVFGRSKDQGKVIGRISESFRRVTLGVLRVAFLSAFVLEFLAMLSTALVAVALGLRLIDGTISYQEAFFILIIAPEFYLPLRSLGVQFHARLSGENAAKRIFEVLEHEQQNYNVNEQDDGIVKINPGESKTLPNQEFFLSLRHIDLRYDDKTEKALADICLDVGPGERIALVGPSGAGKTSILQILLGFIAPTSGEVWVRGNILNEDTLESWRSEISYVAQKPYLFAGTILENLRFSKPQASQAEVIEAARHASAHDFILQLPQGYDTVLGEGGTRLSGGQAQRLAIARAFLKDSPLLLLDEVTSGLDSESEQEVLTALEKLCLGKTVLFTTHRMNTILAADRIIVLDQGRIAEEGSHQELLEAQGLYARLVREYRGGAS